MPSREQRLRQLAKGAGGRPRSEVPEGAAATIRKAAALGRTLQGIAVRLDTNRKTLARWLSEDERLQEALDVGRAEMEHKLHSVLFKAAMDGHVVAAIYLTKARCGWIEGRELDPSARINVNITLPGAMSREQFSEMVIENERQPRTE